MAHYVTFEFLYTALAVSLWGLAFCLVARHSTLQTVRQAVRQSIRQSHHVIRRID